MPNHIYVNNLSSFIIDKGKLVSKLQPFPVDEDQEVIRSPPWKDALTLSSLVLIKDNQRQEYP
jgi:hypothetical protein